MGKDEASAARKWKRGEVRPLTTDERMALLILAIYLGIFCLCTFLFWESLTLRILGVTAATGGMFLFVASFFNTEAPEKSHSIHPLRSSLFSFFTVLLSLFLIRFIGGLISNYTASVVVIYGGVLVALVVFRKALVQVVTILLAVVFLFISISNWHDILVGQMTFRNTVRQCGHVVFRIGPIQEVANLLIAGNYMGYLSKVDYRDTQINILATRKVAACGDDKLRKTAAILDFVSKQIYYVSDPDDGAEYAKDPISTLLAGGGDCEDQTLLLCSMLESVGVNTYVAFTDEHVFALVDFEKDAPGLFATPFVFIDGKPCYALDPADPGSVIGRSLATPQQVKRVFDVRRKAPVHFTLQPDGE
ncbi:MAG: hypothetical protein K9M54_12895 [Kiritimatiellales bacterium]|nr:hypothetical protein [Kiritimatiellales bacterium]MCF7864745.1 hypothetical protein [Kiritimatiellales bacterium]